MSLFCVDRTEFSLNADVRYAPLFFQHEPEMFFHRAANQKQYLSSPRKIKRTFFIGQFVSLCYIRDYTHYFFRIINRIYEPSGFSVIKLGRSAKNKANKCTKSYTLKICDPFACILYTLHLTRDISHASRPDNTTIIAIQNRGPPSAHLSVFIVIIIALAPHVSSKS